MRIYNSYILTVASLLLASTVILAALGQNSLEAYYIVYILEALAVTELYVYLSARARRGLNRVSLLLFAGFLLIVAQRIFVGLA